MFFADSTMPTIVDISENELEEFLGTGGLKPDTLVKRKRHYDEVSKLQVPSI